MRFADVPLIFALIGLVLYTILGGADFGAGLWQLTAARGPAAERIRDHAHAAIAPVWEANHVWLIFVLTVVWTAYPLAFASFASTLTIPLFVAAIGIIFRGASYALHAGATGSRDHLLIDTVFSLSSVLTPFALGAAVGGIASRRVPVGNAEGDLLTSWLNPTSILVGVLAVVVGAFLSAAYLAADAMRQDDAELESRFRHRALGSGVLAGAVALGGLAVIRFDARPLFDGLVTGPGLPALIVSALAGVGTLALVRSRRFGPARYTAALAVAAIVAGWALAQRPVFLPGLTVAQAAAPTDTLVTVTVAVLAGAAILFPSLALLFRLVLRGTFDPGTHDRAEVDREPRGPGARAPGRWARAAGACLVAGIGLLTVAEAGWAHAGGVVCLLGFITLGFVAVGPAEVALAEPTAGAEGSRHADRG